VVAVVSNFETIHGPASPFATGTLSISLLRPTKPITFVSGQKQAVHRNERRVLASLAQKDPEAVKVYEALFRLNKEVAGRTPLVSPACFTGHVRLTGEGGGRPNGMDNRPFNPKFIVPPEMQASVDDLLKKQFPGGARLTGTSFKRAEATEEYHRTQLREKPDDPNTYNNYGVYLKDKKKDEPAAETAYRQALELDPNHVNALGNLANILWERGEKESADSLYMRALNIDPGCENVTWNYVRFLNAEEKRFESRDLLNKGLAAHPDSNRLQLLSADMYVHDGAARDALHAYERARELRGDQTHVEAGYAVALHMSGAPPSECIPAYHVAISLNPKNAALRLNLSQLLFINGDTNGAEKELERAFSLGLEKSAQIEGELYRLAHTPSDPSEVIGRLRSILNDNGKLKWNVERNIEILKKAKAKEVLVQISLPLW
jgi:Tfp pilus assembly protein PilF